MFWEKIKASWFGENMELKTFVDVVLVGAEKLIFEYNIPDSITADMSKRLQGAKNHLEMVKAIRPFFSSTEFSGLLRKCEKMHAKSDRVAQMLMSRASEFQKKFNMKMALRAHNLALSFAKSSKILGEIYRSRSFLLFTLDEMDGCIFDTKMGKSLSRPDSLTQELRIRLLKCEIITKFVKTTDPALLANREFCKNNLFRLEGQENEFIPGASNLIEIRKDGENKRGLFVTGPIPAGTSLILENAYVSTLTEGLTWEMNHCWKCSKRIKWTVPCPSCVFAVYCSDECRTVDMDQGHRYECPCLPYFHGTNVDENIYLGFKSICKAGPTELLKIYSASKTYGDFREGFGFDPITRKYDGNSYLTVANLIGHTENIDKLPPLVLAALSFTEILSSRTNFFDQIKHEGFKDFVSSMALYHAISTPFNLVSLHDMKNLSEQGKIKMGIFKIGLYPLVSLLNHSCDPNVGRASLIDGQIVIMALRDFVAGDELLMSYGYEFSIRSLQLRRGPLLELYNFFCECLACSNEWPVYEEFPTRFRCPDCTGHFSYCDYKKCMLEVTAAEANEGKCRNCNKLFNLCALNDEITNYPSPCEETRKCLKENRPCDAIPILLEYTHFLQSKICPPSNQLAWAERLKKKVYFKISHMED